MKNGSGVLALDIGTVRIGVAVASADAQIPRPLVTLANGENFTEQLQQLIDNESIGRLVVGLPRGLGGQDTPQTAYVREFTENLQTAVDLPLSFQDEALSSTRARQELEARGKLYQKGDVDALAATYILEDYLIENRM